jgi:hypothetical protein
MKGCTNLGADPMTRIKCRIYHGLDQEEAQLWRIKRRIKFGPSSEKIRKENREWTWAQFAKKGKINPAQQ